MPQLIALGAAILCGAAMQRVTGMGFALIAAPFLVLIRAGRGGNFVPG